MQAFKTIVIKQSYQLLSGMYMVATSNCHLYAINLLLKLNNIVHAGIIQYTPEQQDSIIT